ncbi:MAG: CoA-binding protein, partial [Chloroflexota bacterium]
MPNITDNPDAIRDVLENATVIAVVGHSHLPEKASYRIANYLRGSGYKVYAVNPTVDEINGMTSYRTLADIPEPVDIVDVFRGPRHLPRIVDEAAAIGAKTVWGQLTVTHPDA